jgi:hypothetical protein
MFCEQFRLAALQQIVGGIVGRETVAEDAQAQVLAARSVVGIASFLQPIGEDETRRIVVGIFLDGVEKASHFRVDGCTIER